VEAVEDVPGVLAFERDDFQDLSLEVLENSTTPILIVILTMSFLVGAILVALTVYTSVLEKEREFGVMKALGTRPIALFGVVLQQSLICCVLGFAIGEALVFVASDFAGDQVPQFVTQIRASDGLWVFFATLIMGTIAAFVPAARIIRIDALSVFKA
jgi:putative ABC transport system permease protein